MKIYLCTSSTCESTEVRAVFTTKIKADSFAEKFNYEVEEWPCDIEIGNYRHPWIAMVRGPGEIGKPYCYKYSEPEFELEETSTQREKYKGEWHFQATACGWTEKEAIDKCNAAIAELQKSTEKEGLV